VDLRRLRRRGLDNLEPEPWPQLAQTRTPGPEKENEQREVRHEGEKYARWWHLPVFFSCQAKPAEGQRLVHRGTFCGAAFRIDMEAGSQYCLGQKLLLLWLGFNQLFLLINKKIRCFRLRYSQKAIYFYGIRSCSMGGRQ